MEDVEDRESLPTFTITLVGVVVGEVKAGNHHQIMMAAAVMVAVTDAT